MYSFQSKSDWIILNPRRVIAGLHIYSSQLSSIGTNPQAKQSVVNRDLKTLYKLWPEIWTLMYSFHSKSNWIIFIPRRVKAGLYT
jgi:hypothetical protein